MMEPVSSLSRPHTLRDAGGSSRASDKDSYGVPPNQWGRTSFVRLRGSDTVRTVRNIVRWRIIIWEV